MQTAVSSSLPSVVREVGNDAGNPKEAGSPKTTQIPRLKRRPPVAVLISAGWLVLLVLAVLLAPILPLPDPTMSNYSAVAALPGEVPGHVLGADSLGRDILSRLVMGASVSLSVGIGSIALATVVGALVGLIAGFFGGLWDRILSAVIDIMLSFPGIVAVIAITVFFGASMPTLIVGISVLFIPQIARVTRSVTKTYANREFVLASRGMGAGEFRILLREVLPNVVSSVVAFSATLIAIAISLEGGLSFLGLGVPPPQTSWGAMMGEGRGELQSSPHIVMIPALTMCFTLLAINFVADYIGKQFDIRESVL